MPGNRVAEIFSAAVKIKGELERQRYLDRACAGDTVLRHEVDALLRAHDQADGFLEEPGFEAVKSQVFLGRYKLLERIGAGATGEVWKAEQLEPVRRTVAVKLLRPEVCSPSVLDGFKRESQALATMDHPSIARVFDAGVTPDGRPFFVMELVSGGPITSSCAAKRATVPQRLELFQEVCRAIAHAHQKRIVHRDIKPGNVLTIANEDRLVPKVIDFGIALALDGERQPNGVGIGTPAYMAPEQVSLDKTDIDTRADVYGLGALLYELITGQSPLAAKGITGPIPLVQLNQLLSDLEPLAPSEIVSSLDKDLDAIILKALESDRDRRYANPLEMVADIQRFFDNEPVDAVAPSRGYKLRKFVRRNLAAVLVWSFAFLFLASAAIAASQWYQAANARAVAAMQELEIRDRIIRLSDLQLLREAKSAAEQLWPATPDNQRDMETWLQLASELGGRLEGHQDALRRLRHEALPYTPRMKALDRKTHPRADELARRKQRFSNLAEQRAARQSSPTHRVAPVESEIAALEEQIDELEELVQRRRSWRFADQQTQWQHDTLAALVADLEVFFDNDPHRGAVESVKARLAFASEIEARSIRDPDAAALWAYAIDDIRRRKIYDGLTLRPQLGLLPLRCDPRSGLWEFWHLQTGSRPRLNPDPNALNAWRIDEGTGLVFVLIPGGSFLMGAQYEDGQPSNADSKPGMNEGPVTEVTLSAFFLSKYEMTQSQWARFTGQNPSTYKTDDRMRVTAWNPVEQVSWPEAQRVMQQLDLVLPTEAQWEYATRAGSSTPWWVGAEKQLISEARAGNLADDGGIPFGNPSSWIYEPWDDGYPLHAPVGSYAANGFGLHDVIGNVWEWCRDDWGDYRPDGAVGERDGLRLYSFSGNRAARGGSYTNIAATARSSARTDYDLQKKDKNLGVRPARLVVE